jgi:hypothetical protein
MNLAIGLSDQELSELQIVTNSDSATEAVTRAAREFLRTAGLKQLKSVSGKVEFDLDWHAVEQLELGEAEFPG